MEEKRDSTQSTAVKAVGKIHVASGACFVQSHAEMTCIQVLRPDSSSAEISWDLAIASKRIIPWLSTGDALRAPSLQPLCCLWPWQMLSCSALPMALVTFAHLHVPLLPFHLHRAEASHFSSLFQLSSLMPTPSHP